MRNATAAENYVKYQTPKLEGHELARLVLMAREGNRTALTAIVTSCQCFIADVARHYAYVCRDVSYGEMMSCGNSGLLKAVERFDVLRNVKFLSYAVHWIRKEMREYVMNNKSVRIPPNKIRDMNKAARAYEQDLVTYNKSRLSAQDVDVLLDMQLTPPSTGGLEDSIDSLCSTDDGEDFEQVLPNELRTNLYGNLPFASDYDTDVEIGSVKCSDVLGIIASALEPRERIVFTAYLSMGEFEGADLTYSDIGAMIGTTGERARQIYLVAYEKVRTHIVRASIREQLCIL